MDLNTIISQKAKELEKVSSTPMLDIELILSKALEKDREWLLINSGYKLSKNKKKTDEDIRSEKKEKVESQLPI